MDIQSVSPLGKIGSIGKGDSGGSKVGSAEPHAQSVTTVETGHSTKSSMAVSGAKDAPSAFDAQLPLAILKSPLLQKVEWAWRRVVGELLDSMLSGGANFVESGKLTQARAMPNPTPRASQVLTNLWENISNLASGDQQQAPKSSWVSISGDERLLIPYSTVTQATLMLQTPREQALILQDRLLTGVEYQAYERIGNGVYLLPQTGQSKGRPDVRRDAVNWKAQRQTRIGSRGQVVHRLQLDVAVNQHPLRCIITASHPTLIVHFATNDLHLQDVLQAGVTPLTATVRATGWNLDKLTVGSLVTEEDS